MSAELERSISSNDFLGGISASPTPYRRNSEESLLIPAKLTRDELCALISNQLNNYKSVVPRKFEFSATPLSQLGSPLFQSPKTVIQFTTIGETPIAEGSSKTVVKGNFLSSDNLPQSDSPTPSTPRYVLSIAKDPQEKVQYEIAICTEVHQLVPENTLEILYVSEDCSKVVMQRYRRFEDLFQMDKSQKITAAYQICKTFHTLHDHGIAHFDIKPDNILLGSDNEPRIIDFGCALRVLRNGETSKESLKITHGYTTEPYSSPQEIHPENCPKARDVYSLGATIFYLFTNGKIFWKECASIIAPSEQLPDQQFLNYSGSTSNEIIHRVIVENIADVQLSNCLKQMLNLNPSQRVTMEGVVHHPFFREAARQDLVDETIISDLSHKTIAVDLVGQLLE